MPPEIYPQRLKKIIKIMLCGFATVGKRRKNRGRRGGYVIPPQRLLAGERRCLANFCIKFYLYEAF
jgi:hypothetical protein